VPEGALAVALEEVHRARRPVVGGRRRARQERAVRGPAVKARAPRDGEESHGVLEHLGARRGRVEARVAQGHQRVAEARGAPRPRGGGGEEAVEHRVVGEGVAHVAEAAAEELREARGVAVEAEEEQGVLEAPVRVPPDVQRRALGVVEVLRGARADADLAKERLAAPQEVARRREHRHEALDQHGLHRRQGEKLLAREVLPGVEHPPHELAARALVGAQPRRHVAPLAHRRDALDHPVEARARDHRQVDAHAGAEAGDEAPVAGHHHEGPLDGVVEREGHALGPNAHARLLHDVPEQRRVVVERQRELHMILRDPIEARQEVVSVSHVRRCLHLRRTAATRCAIRRARVFSRGAVRG
jgi:hypothetical protein